MKFLIENYSNDVSTQPLYFNKHINETQGYKAFIRHNNASLFDIFDTIKPDVYITSINTLSKDALLYLQENQNIKLLISIDGLQEDNFINLDRILQSYNVQCHFFFSSRDKSYSRKHRFVTIRNGADINIKQDLSINYRLNKCIVTQKDNQKVDYKKKYTGAYHVVTSNQSLVATADAYIPITLMPSVYRMYDEILFVDIDSDIPQAFFDALYYGNKVYYDITDENIATRVREAIANIIGNEYILDYNDTNKTDNFVDIKNVIRDKHTALNRTKTLLSQLPQKNNGDK